MMSFERVADAAMSDDEQLALERRLRAKFDVIETTIALGEHTLRMLHPRSADDLLDEEAFDHDGRIPYWAEIWPSSRVLGERLFADRGTGRRLLELGCGAGFASLAAALAGFEVVATDYYPEALEFVRLNAARNGVPGVSTRMVDWRDFPAELCALDLVVGADVLYERDHAGLVCAAISRSLAPGGRAMLVDPRRAGAQDLPAACRRHKLTIARHEQVIFNATDRQVTIDLYAIHPNG
jgi:predicted nicotinamide N-methyase